MKIENIQPFVQSVTVQNIVHAYQIIFGGDPWNEGFQCPICKIEVPLSFKSNLCPKCYKSGKHIVLVESWPTSKVTSDFYHEMSKPEALCLIAKVQNKLVGFAWGYKIQISPDIDEHLDAPGVHKIVKGEFFYLDEVAVIPEYQFKGIGKRLTKEIFSFQKHKIILLRTLADSPMFRLVKNIGGRVLLNISKNRVIMSLEIEY